VAARLSFISSKNKNPTAGSGSGVCGSKPRQHPTAALRSSSALISSRVFTFKFTGEGYRLERAKVKSYFESAANWPRLIQE
jgi:hypothetical protein